MVELNKSNWAYLMQKAQEGDKSCYRTLLDELRIWLLAYFNKRTHNSIAEDLVQETLIAIHTKRETFDPSREFIPWLAAIARHKWIDRLRKNLKYIETELNDDYASPQCQNECAKYDVQNLLRILPAKQAKIIELAKLQEYSIEEVANELGLSQSFVKVAIHRGLKTMQEKVRKGQDG
jgi:RNA polymerase sigma-70 factor, ECF subfamily